ncbi:MAG: hypothetical protein CL678_17155 [Bdellovibrionaceae bacterium]|nr:hypothetical protein [Pseudobdellovibrionaceae bacterium]
MGFFFLSWTVHASTVPFCGLQSFELSSRVKRRNPQIKPTAPKLLAQEIDVETPGCIRSFEYDGEIKQLDSFHKQDGERLRKYISSSPTAIELLDTYQKNRRKAIVAAYTGTAGLLIILSGLLAQNFLSKQSDKDAVRVYTLYGGSLVALGGFSYSYLILRKNENHLKEAVHHYNNSGATEKIKLQLNTGIFF